MKPKPRPAEKRYSSAELSGRWGIPARTIRDILQRADLDKTGGYNKDEAEVAVITHLRNALSQFDVEAAKDRARKSKAEADNAEIDAAHKRGKIKEGMMLSMRDAMLKVRSIHEGLDLPMAMRKRVCKEIQDIEMIIPRI